MKTITVLETADELLNAAMRTRSTDDNSPYLPKDVVIVLDLNNNRLGLTGDGSERFMLGENLAQQPEEFMQAALKRQGFEKVRFGDEGGTESA